VFVLGFTAIHLTPAATRACTQGPPTNLPPTVCVNVLSNCQAQIIIKGYGTFGTNTSTFCSCAFEKVPSIVSVDKVEIKVCSSNDGPCAATGPLLPGFQNGGQSGFVTNQLASSFFTAAANTGQPWQGFFSAVYSTIPQGVCIDIVFTVTLTEPCSAIDLQADLTNYPPIIGTSAANSDGMPNGGHLAILPAGSVSIGRTDLRARSIGLGGGGVALGFTNAVPGRLYQIQATTNLTVSGSWATVGTTNGDANGAFEFFDPNANAFTNRFYRATPAP
jgi:hypothetical protein